MNTRRLARKARRQARRDWWSNRITDQEFFTVMEACKDEEVLQRWLEEIDSQLNMKVLYGGGWSDFFRNLWDWFANNWDEILEILLRLLPLILMERYNANS